MASSSINLYTPLPRSAKTRALQSTRVAGVLQRRVACCSAVQESSTAAVADKKEVEPKAEATKAAEPAAAPAAKPAAKTAPPKKPPAKPLPQLMEEEVIPSLKSVLEAEEDLSEINISFQDNRLEGAFLKKDKTYCFWAFFPSGTLTGPKGFSLASYGTEPSTIEPFLVDEKRITGKQIVFWVEKRLAAQGILPVWKEERNFISCVFS